MADYRLQARIPEALSDKLFEVIKEKQERTQNADVTVSSILRAALEEYLQAYEKSKRYERLIIDVPVEYINEEDLRLLQYKLYDIAKSIGGEGEELSPLNEVMNGLVLAFSRMYMMKIQKKFKGEV
jgi:anion-transporting  ArsA/GET3 family ATPase